MKFLSTGIDANGVEDFVAAENGRIVMKRVCHDVEPLLDRNKALATHDDGYSHDRSMRRVASIPFGLIEIWKSTYGVDPTAPGNNKLLSRLLNDADLRFLRTAPGRVDFRDRH